MFFIFFCIFAAEIKDYWIMNLLPTIRINSKATYFLSNLLQKKRKTTPISLISLLRQTINETKHQCKPSTYKNKVTAVNTFQRFLAETMHAFGPITIDSLTPEVIKSFEQWALNEGQKPNYISLHMRCLRTLINQINGRGTVLFKNVCTANRQTEKRAVGEETIRHIRELALPSNTNAALARDIFLFCFYGMGIPLVDAVMLKKSQLHDGHIIYNRHKTNRMVKVPVCKELQQLLERLSPSDSPYLLPVLSNDRTDNMRQYKSFYQRYMRGLKCIARQIGQDCKLTSYTPRHSWASIAYKNGVNINNIAQALGHANTNITYLYIKELSCWQLETANKIVMQAVQ
jgi:integrase